MSSGAAQLVAAIKPGGARRVWPLPKTKTTLGSGAENDLVVPAATVSGRHAVITRRDGGWEITDLNSTNGTFVNGRRVQNSCALRKGDELRLGAVCFEFLEPEVRPSQSSAGSIDPGRSARARSSRIAANVIVAAFLIGFSAVFYWLASRHSGGLAYLSGPAPAAPSPASQPSSEVAAIQPPNPPEVPGNESANRAQPLTLPAAWLDRLNFYRSMAGVPPVHEDPLLSHGDLKHAQYIVKNYSDVLRNGRGLGAEAHTETRGRPFFSEEGLAAAARSDTFEGCAPFSTADEIDGLMAGPMHRLSLLTPGLKDVGYGRFDEADCWASALAVDAHVAVRSAPVEFPPPNSVSPLTSFSGEWPSPLTSCSDYDYPAGAAITIQFGHGRPVLSKASLTRNGREVPNCAFDATTYQNPDPSQQDYGRKVLETYGAVVLLPRAPLTKGASYKVDMTVGGQQYSWSFSVAPGKPSSPPADNVEESDSDHSQ